ncbi:MAG: hypothetical protein R3324_01580, partial [Halobacteriales archaeon]|nr:hypothetical protein [Halobacteriales archaeon]
GPEARWRSLLVDTHEGDYVEVWGVRSAVVHLGDRAEDLLADEDEPRTDGGTPPLRPNYGYYNGWS